MPAAAMMFQKTVLDNGIRLVTEKLPSRTVSVGVWVDVGSRDEHSEDNGCAHFAEHMFFKGTPQRSPQQIARELDILGGMSNAFTSQENTCFYATVLDDQVARITDLLADIFLNSSLAEDEIVRERDVILQEISMVEDTPDDQVHEVFSGLLWGDHPLGQTVLGSREVVGTMDRQHIEKFVSGHYGPDRVLIAASGNLDHAAFCADWQEKFREAPTRKSGVARRIPDQQDDSRQVITKPLEQVHMVLGTYGLAVAAEQRLTIYLLNVLLGGNMSSRLFQEIREKRGLAYSVYSYLASFSDSGHLGIYLGVEARTINKALALTGIELGRLAHESVSPAELENAKDYAKAGIILAAENMEARMNRLARNELYFGRYIPFEEIVEEINRVQAEDLRALAEQLFARPLTAAVIGPVTADDIDWQHLSAK